VHARLGARVRSRARSVLAGGGDPTGKQELPAPPVRSAPIGPGSGRSSLCEPTITRRVVRTTPRSIGRLGGGCDPDGGDCAGTVSNVPLDGGAIIALASACDRCGLRRTANGHRRHQRRRRFPRAANVLSCAAGVRNLMSRRTTAEARSDTPAARSEGRQNDCALLPACEERPEPSPIGAERAGGAGSSCLPVGSPPPASTDRARLRTWAPRRACT
jgi:hypothetical protein